MSSPANASNFCFLKVEMLIFEPSKYFLSDHLRQIQVLRQEKPFDHNPLSDYPVLNG